MEGSMRAKDALLEIKKMAPNKFLYLQIYVTLGTDWPSNRSARGIEICVIYAKTEHIRW